MYFNKLLLLTLLLMVTPALLAQEDSTKTDEDWDWHWEEWDDWDEWVADLDLRNHDRQCRYNMD